MKWCNNRIGKINLQEILDWTFYCKLNVSKEKSLPASFSRIFEMLTSGISLTPASPKRAKSSQFCSEFAKAYCIVRNPLFELKTVLHVRCNSVNSNSRFLNSNIYISEDKRLTLLNEWNPRIFRFRPVFRQAAEGSASILLCSHIWAVEKTSPDIQS